MFRLGVVLVALVMVASLGLPMLWLVAVQATPWGGWWLAGQGSGVVNSRLPPVTAQPGVVPLPAVQAPHGPILGEDAGLMAAIAPWMGVPYVFGGNTRAGVDCSGFTVAVFRALGVSLPRTAQTQYDATLRVLEPQIGDLVFFEGTYDSRPDRISHVGIVVGTGVMVSAVQPSVGRQSLGSAYWQSHFVGYGRIRSSQGGPVARAVQPEESF